MDEVKILIKKEFFSSNTKNILNFGSLKAEIFKYSTGVEALKLYNNLGYIIQLPFRGQQIWSAVFEDRVLTMKSLFDEPRNVDSFLLTYGCFLMHCGALRMGCPGPEDDHPLHGELPYACYDKAWLVAGEDDNGKYIGLTGLFEHNVAFADKYFAIPTTKIYENHSVINVEIVIENKSNYPMELMYMTHINFRPVEGGEIYQCFDWSKENIVVRESIPQHVSVGNEYKNFISKIFENPSVTKKIKANDIYNPEVVMFIKNPKIDENNLTHYLQVNPNGTSDYVSYNPKIFDHASRWIVRNKNQEALGIALPGTADAEGYLKEKEKGNIKQIPPNVSKKFNVNVGYLNKIETKKMIKKIENIKV
jgi:hypothetical protein